MLLEFFGFFGFTNSSSDILPREEEEVEVEGDTPRPRPGLRLGPGSVP